MTEDSSDRRRNISESLRAGTTNWLIGNDLRERFPTGDGFYGSLWHRWQSHNQEFCADERKAIMKIGEDWSDPDAAAEVRGEEMSVLEDLLDDRSAALLVALWSRAERHLLLHARSIDDADGGGEMKKKPFFDDLKKRCETAYSCEFEQLPGHDAVRVVQVACNSFKHNAGRYQPGRNKSGVVKAHEVLPPAAPEDWNLPATKARFRYRDLPFQTLVNGCGEFFAALDDLRRATRRRGPT